MALGTEPVDAPHDVGFLRVNRPLDMRPAPVAANDLDVAIPVAAAARHMAGLRFHDHGITRPLAGFFSLEVRGKRHGAE